MNSGPKQKRRAVFIHRAFQGRFIAWMLGLILVFGVCSAGILYLLLASELEAETRSVHVRIMDVWERLGLAIVSGNVVSALMSGVLVVIVVLYLSHKIAGPMFRFSRIFDEIGRGNLDVSADLREDDQLKDLAQSLDRLILALRQQRTQRMNGLVEARTLVADLQQSAAEAGGAERAVAIARLDARLAALQKEEGAQEAL
ncbi:MAG: HAMP domain-containing protein [Methylococcaceae bacterium]|nr:HAMP domain-containing protein [Methylococcaceae bacterium]